MRCDACETGEGVVHTTIRVDTLDGKTSKTKIVQVWLCPDCETKLTQVFCKDPNLKVRVARRLTDHPSYLSRTDEWRGKRPRLWDGYTPVASDGKA